MTPRDVVRLGVVHPRGGGHPPALLHQPRRARVRPGQPARSREGSALRPLLAQREEPPPALPRRVHRRAGRRRRPDRGRHRRPQAGRGPLREGLLRVRRRLGGPARRGPPGLRAGVQPPDEDPRVGAPGQLPGAEHPLHRLRRPARRSLPLLPGSGRPDARRSAPATWATWTACSTPTPSWSRRCRTTCGPPCPSRPGDSDFVYRQATRAKALDAVRGVLPAASTLERRHLRLRPGLRGPARADAHPPAAGGPDLRRAHAARAAQGHPELPAPGRPPRSGRGLERLPGAAPAPPPRTS